METSDMIAAVHKYVEAFDKADIDIIRELYSDDATVEDPVGTDAHVGIDAIVGFYEKAMSAGAKLVLTGSPRCAGNAVVFPFQVQMPGMAIEPIDVFEFDDAGKVKSMKAYWGPENLVSAD